jgi:hypothetical protein
MVSYTLLVVVELSQCIYKYISRGPGSCEVAVLSLLVTHELIALVH